MNEDKPYAGDGTEGRTRRRRIKIRYILLVLLIGFFAWRNWPLLYSHSEQDQCTFGTGSTALYDRLRAEADTYLAKHGKARLSEYSPKAAQAFADEVLEQLRAFAMTRNTPTERWASIHALLRAYGMEFDGNGPRDKKKLKSDLIVLWSRYIIPLPKLNWYCPLCYVFPTAAFRMYIKNSRDGTYDRIEGGLWIQRFGLKWGPIYYAPEYQICPTVTK